MVTDDLVQSCLGERLLDPKSPYPTPMYVPYVFKPFVEYAFHRLVDHGFDRLLIDGGMSFVDCDPECKTQGYSGRLDFQMGTGILSAGGYGEKHPRQTSLWEGLTQFSLSTLPGCGGVLVSHRTYVANEMRGKGVGDMLQELKAHFARIIRVGKLIATVRFANRAEEACLERNGWKMAGPPFRNPRSGSKLVMWEKEIE